MEERASVGDYPLSLSEGSFTSGGLMNLFLKEASPLAVF
jgi:hypothetical protein